MTEEKWQVHAHRGGCAEFDENTLSAFKSSFENGVRGFETDVRMCGTGELVIMHDSSIERTTKGTGRIEELSKTELENVQSKRGNPVLFLDELLSFFEDKPGLYIEFEMKTDSPLYPTEQMEEYCVKLYESVISKTPENATVVFTSFDKRPLTFMKKTFPEADLMLITKFPCSDSVVQETIDLGLSRLACPWDGCSRADVRAAHEAGLVLVGWPGKRVTDFLLGAMLGFDHMCADNPVEVLEFKKNMMKWLE